VGSTSIGFVIKAEQNHEWNKPTCQTRENYISKYFVSVFFF